MVERSIDWDKVRADILTNGPFHTHMIAVMPQHEPHRLFSSVPEGIFPIRQTVEENIPEAKGCKSVYYRHKR